MAAAGNGDAAKVAGRNGQPLPPAAPPPLTLKERHEIRHLRKQIEALDKQIAVSDQDMKLKGRAWLRPATLISAVVAVGTICGLLLQVFLLGLDLRKSELKFLEAQVDTKLAKAEKADLTVEVTRKRKELEVAQSETARLTKELVDARRALGVIKSTGREVPRGEAIKVNGQIVNEWGEPVVAFLRVTNEIDGRVLAQQKTDRNGKFELSFPSGDRFSLDVMPELTRNQFHHEKGLAGNADHFLRIMLYSQYSKSPYELH